MAPDDSGEFVHPSAEIEPDVVLGAGSRVWRFAHIRRGAVIGEACTISANVFIDVDVKIGARVKIQNNVSVYAGVEIQDDVLVGPSAVFTNDRHPRARGAWTRVSTHVRRGASIGANATLVGGIDVGEDSMVAAGAVVTRDVEPRELVAGNPARRLGWVCVCGHTIARTAGPHPAIWACASCGRTNPAEEPRIRLHQVEVRPATERLVADVLRSGQLAEGPMVDRFEREWAGIVGVAHGVAVTSGTSALVLALKACGVGPGDEVVTSPLTFAATLSSILEVGATARFADVTEDGTMSPEGFERVCNDQTRAVIPVHIYGRPADMEAIASVAAAGDVVLIEDAAQAHGARVGDRSVGSFGVGCFSFYATKNLSTGEGGMITTDDAGVAARARSLRNHGREPTGEHAIVGHNYRMSDVQAAIGVGQLATFSESVVRRRQIAAALSDGLAGVPGLRVFRDPPGRTAAPSLYTIRIVASDLGATREEVAHHAARHGVETGIYYPRLVYDHAAFRDHPNVVVDPVPVAQAMVSEVLSLPVHPALREGDVERIVHAVRCAVSKPAKCRR
ncbi:MAG: aminotransferase class V-fold PLP-dependent enzyme [Actinomycetota bacterium]|nr:aminotransferase class V-fold PLP-dependent enzyme [Actinomycetota bacterium]